MPRSERTDDVTTLLFIVPFAVPAVYGLVLWLQSGLSATLPVTVYLTITRDPITFLVGFLAVLAAVSIDVFSAQGGERKARLSEDQGTMQKLATAAFALSLVFAVYANGGNIGNSALDFLVGRYSLVFPALVFLTSYLMAIPFHIGANQTLGIIGAVLLLGVPAVIEVGKHHTTVAFPLAFVLLVAGVFLFVWQWSMQHQPAKQT